MGNSIDIIFLSLLRHDWSLASSSLSLAKEFSRKNRIFYIDHPYSVKDLFSAAQSRRFSKRLATIFARRNEYHPVSGHANMVAVTPALTWPINFFPEGKVYDMLSHVNDAILFSCIRRLISDYHIKDFIYINAYDPYFGLNFPSDIKPLKKVYLSLDDLSQVPYTAKHGIRMEREMMKKYDDTLVTSRELYRLHAPFANKLHYYPNAADFNIFSKALDYHDRPEELKSLNRPLIGYIGNIDERPDYELLRKIADDNKDKFLVMIGPVNTTEHHHNGLDSLANVVFTGPKKVEQLPAYLKYFDCMIIPFKCNVLTRSIYPLKINEYLAAGKPVIATHFSEDIKTFDPVAYIADSHEDFLAMLKKSIAEDSEDKKHERITEASRNTWESRVEVFWKIMAIQRMDTP